MKYEAWGCEYDLGCVVYEYAMNGNVAIQLIDKEDGCTYGMLTVNLGDPLPNGYAYIDVNNIPDAEKLIDEYGLGEYTGRKMQSGFCLYPEYKLNLDNIKKYAMEV